MNGDHFDFSEELKAQFLETKELTSSSLMVSVDFLELVDREGWEKAYEVVGKLKDLLG